MLGKCLTCWLCAISCLKVCHQRDWPQQANLHSCVPSIQRVVVLFVGQMWPQNNLTPGDPTDIFQRNASPVHLRVALIMKRHFQKDQKASAASRHGVTASRRHGVTERNGKPRPTLLQSPWSPNLRRTQEAGEDGRPSDSDPCGMANHSNLNSVSQ